MKGTLLYFLGLAALCLLALVGIVLLAVAACIFFPAFAWGH